jgi:hypothetical protein
MTARKTRQYVAAAVESLTLAVELFNRPSPTGREHATVMMAAHAFEMLLKAAIFEQRGKTKFSGSDRSFDLGRHAQTRLPRVVGGATELGAD